MHYVSQLFLALLHESWGHVSPEHTKNQSGTENLIMQN